MTLNSFVVAGEIKIRSEKPILFKSFEFIK